MMSLCQLSRCAQGRCRQGHDQGCARSAEGIMGRQEETIPLSLSVSRDYQGVPGSKPVHKAVDVDRYVGGAPCQGTIRHWSRHSTQQPLGKPIPNGALRKMCLVTWLTMFPPLDVGF
jgi:hypothetical protein